MSPENTLPPDISITSAVVNPPDAKLLELNTKQQLKRLAQKLLPNRRFRVMSDSKDARSQGHAIALLEEIGTNGKLVFVTGGPNLSLVANFLKVKIDAGEIK